MPNTGAGACVMVGERPAGAVVAEAAVLWIAEAVCEAVGFAVETDVASAAVFSTGFCVSVTEDTEDPAGTHFA